MAKQAAQQKGPSPKDEPKKDLATVDTSRQVPDHLRSRLAESTGKGVSTKREDNILPLVYVVQKSSAYTDERHESYVEGAKPGELWVRGTTRIISGKTGWVIQPCAFLKCWNEWGAKRGDGFKGRHPERPEDAVEKELPNEQGELVMKWVRANGNIVVEAREHYVMDGRDAFVISMGGTQHTVSRTWMALMNQFRDEKGAPFDSFSRQYKLTTVLKEKGGNSWYVIHAEDAGWVSAEQYDLGAALHDAVMSGEKVADNPDEEPGSDGGGGARDDDAAARAGI